MILHVLMGLGVLAFLVAFIAMIVTGWSKEYHANVRRHLAEAAMLRAAMLKRAREELRQ